MMVLRGGGLDLGGYERLLPVQRPPSSATPLPSSPLFADLEAGGFGQKAESCITPARAYGIPAAIIGNMQRNAAPGDEASWPARGKVVGGEGIGGEEEERKGEEEEGNEGGEDDDDDIAMGYDVQGRVFQEVADQEDALSDLERCPSPLTPD